uniref:Uncharacterized protein n=1 Tax=Arion vulgaris TaxID=1028688 RepID=A0A0B6YVE5_9EUPU
MTAKSSLNAMQSQKSGTDTGRASMSMGHVSKGMSSSKINSMTSRQSKDVENDQEEEQNTGSVVGDQSRRALTERQSFAQSRVTLRVPGDENVEEEELSDNLMGYKEEEDQFIQIDESTRKFNFWTHQVHIFLVLKFFPYAKKYIEIKKLVETRRLEEAKMRLMVASELDATDVPTEPESVVDSKTELAEDEEEEEATHVEDVQP